jgi:hypothetical protein
MSEAKHTPGPWSVQPGSSNPLIGSAEYTVAEVLDDCFPDTEQQQANASLIAAAPDLLAACEKAEAFVKYALEFWDWRNFPNLEESAQLLATQLREAKAKATGA